MRQSVHLDARLGPCAALPPRTVARMHPQHLTLASRPERLHGHGSPDYTSWNVPANGTTRGSLPVAAPTALILASTRRGSCWIPRCVCQTQLLLQSTDPARCTSLNYQTARWERWSAELKAWATASFQRSNPEGALLLLGSCTSFRRTPVCVRRHQTLGNSLNT